MSNELNGAVVVTVEFVKMRQLRYARGTPRSPEVYYRHRPKVIVYNTVGSVTYEQLEALVAPLIAEE